MGFWIFLLCNCLMVPVIMWGAVKVYGKWPASRNSIYGYRSNSSMQSDEAWVYAQEEWMKTWRKLAKWMLLPVLFMFFCLGKSEDTISTCATVVIVIQLVLMLGSIPIIERKVRRKFPH